MAETAKEIIQVNLEDEMRKSYLDYAMSVIVGRALPDARDGLKPVHRRVLFAMNELNAHSNKPYFKSARIVGDVIGKYHPHGDQSVYDTLVRLAQPFSLRYMLVDGQGNFGSIDGDSAAAMRYTEARMSRLAHELMADIDKETVDFQPNYDEKELEPTVMPTRFPNLLVNGSAGIAVGMATNIPPHNLSESINACIALIDNPEIDVDGLMEYIPGPDFPTAGIINGTAGIVAGYRTGRGRVRIRAKADIEVADNGRESIIVTEIPYQVNKARLIEKIAELVKEKKIEGISELRDESDKDGMRIYIEIKRGESAEVVLNNLYQQTQMESVFGINMVALVDGRPQLMNLKQMLEAFVRHRREVVTPPPPESGPPPYRVRAAQGARPCPRAGRPDRRAGQHRRDDRTDQDLAEPERSTRTHAGPRVGAGPGRCDAGCRRRRSLAPGRPAQGRGPDRGRLPADRDPGHPDPGNAPAPPDRAGAGPPDR